MEDQIVFKLHNPILELYLSNPAQDNTYQCQGTKCPRVLFGQEARQHDVFERAKVKNGMEALIPSQLCDMVLVYSEFTEL